MNLGEIVKNVNAELSPATNIDALIKRWANRAQKRFVTVIPHRFSWLILNGLTLTTAASQSEYTLSPLLDMAKGVSIWDPSRKWKLDFITREQFQERYPNPADVMGDPQVGYQTGVSPVATQPTSASTLSLVSSSTADNSQVVKIEGLNSSGVLVGEEVTLNGTTPVVTTLTYSRILSRSINNFLAGFLTMTSNGGAVTNAVVGPRQRQVFYPKIILWPTPSGVKSLPYEGDMKLPDLVNDNDMSLIPEDYHDALESYCLFRGHLHKKDSETAALYAQAFQQRVMEAVANDRGPIKEIIVGGGKQTSYLGLGRYPGLFPNS